MKSIKLLLVVSFTLLVLTVIGGAVWAWMLSSGKLEPEPKVAVKPRNIRENVLRVVTDRDYWPYSFMDADGRLSGREIELVIMVANEIGMGVEIQPLSWEECVDAAVAHRADVVLTCAAASTGRETAALDMSSPVEGDSYVVVGKKPISSFEELNGRRIGLMLDGNVNSILYAAGLKPFVHQYPNYREVLEAIGKDEIDYTVARYNPVIGWLREKPIPGVEAKLLLGKSYICFGVDNRRPELLRKINDALGVLRVSGEVKRLTEKWLTTYVKPQGVVDTISQHPSAFTALIAAVAVLLGFLITLALLQIRAARRADESRGIIEGLTRKYNLAYIVNLSSGALEIVRHDEMLLASNREFRDFAALRDYFLAEDVHARDRERMRMELDVDHVRRRLSREPAYKVEFCLEKGGVTSLGRMKVTSVSADVVAIGMAVKDVEIIQDRLSRQRYDDHFAMFTLDLDTGRVKVVKKSPWDDHWAKNSSVPLREAMETIAAHAEGEAGEFFRRVADLGEVKKMFATENVFTYSYRSGSVEGGRWVTVTGRVVIRRDDGAPALITIGFVLTDATGVETLELQQQVRESLAFMNYFVETFVSTYYVNLETHECRVCHRTGQLAADYPEITDYLKAMEEYAERDVHADDRADLLAFVRPEAMKRALAENPIVTHVFRDVSRGVEKTYRFQAIRGADGNCAAFTFSDISEVVRREREQKEKLETALRMAESANRAKTTFLNNMSHDIRTPMNAVIGYTRLAANHIDSKTLVADYLTKIGQSSDHLLSLINDVLDMARIESGRMRLSEASESLPEIIHTIRNIVQSQITAKQLDFFIDCRDVKDENVVCDKLRLSQLLLNILSNAIKYTPAAGTVSLRVCETGPLTSGRAHYVFVVKDTGCGMTPEFLKEVFEPFARARSSTASGVQGTGLGMSIAKNITEMMGGTIDVRSEVDRGTEVTLEFDFALGESKDEIAAEAATLNGLRVLVADDDMDSCISISNMLDKFGMKSEWCTSGKEAVVRARHAHASGEDFAVFLLDWQMPSMNGVETARQIRRAVGDRPPIVIHSSYDWGSVEGEAKEAGVTAFMSKPLFGSELKKMLLKTVVEEPGKGGNAAPETAGAPATVPDRAAALPPSAAEQVLRENRLKGRRILLVEDNETNREITVEFLSEKGMFVDTAMNGLEGVASAKTGRYELILMDVQMPVMDGYEATRAIRAWEADRNEQLIMNNEQLRNSPSSSERGPENKDDHRNYSLFINHYSLSRLPIIALTADAFAEDRTAALEAGMDDHLAKPVQFEDLLACIEKHLGLK